ncbi:MAG: hypothetical protein IH597_01675 [Bacteroidales bacterium]|nr:hypothetical protein [Bacteroidales bacterium]
MKTGRFEDDKGNRSSMREILYILVGVEIALMVVWCCLAFIEARKDSSDWSGLSYILVAIIGIGGLASLSKLIQKKYENSNPPSSTP